MISLKYRKQMKAHQFKALLPLYTEHAMYLLRVIKTVMDDNITNFIDNIDNYINIAKCHEIAINEFFGSDLATHENFRGCEHEISKHPFYSKIGRDLSVKLIWELIYSELSVDPSLQKYMEYKDLEGMIKEHRCPYCNMMNWRLERILVGYHGDGTPNYLEHWEHIYVCEHWLQNDFYDSTDTELDTEDLIQDIESLINDHDLDVDLIIDLISSTFDENHIRDICISLEIGYDRVWLSDDRYGNPDYVIFVEDRETLLNKLRDLLKKTKKLTQ